MGFDLPLRTSMYQDASLSLADVAESCRWAGSGSTDLDSESETLRFAWTAQVSSSMSILGFFESVRSALARCYGAGRGVTW